MLGWLLTILLGACVYVDLRFRQLPNGLNLLILITGLVSLFTAGLSSELMLDHLLAMIIVSTIGLFVFYCGWLGGGDIKLAIALSIWLGTSKLVSFFVVLSLAGGLLAILLLAYNLVAKQLHLHTITTLPYGLAIVTGATVLLI